MTLEQIQAALADDAPPPPDDLLAHIQALEEPMASALEEAMIARFGVPDDDLEVGIPAGL